MRTARSLTVSPSVISWGGVGCLFPGGSGLGGAPGGSGPGGGCFIQHILRADPPTPLWTEFLTHASENITLPQTSFAGGNKMSSLQVSHICSSGVPIPYGASRVWLLYFHINTYISGFTLFTSFTLYKFILHITGVILTYPVQ